jgi:hypothetical protein
LTFDQELNKCYKIRLQHQKLTQKIKELKKLSFNAWKSLSQALGNQRLWGLFETCKKNCMFLGKIFLA